MDTLTEKDIEDGLIDYLNRSDNFVYVGRQINLPMGRIDVMAWNRASRTPYIFEVKKGNIKEADIVQLMGYLYQFNFQVYAYLVNANIDINPHDLKCEGVVIGKGVFSDLAKRFNNAGDDISLWEYSKGTNGFDFDLLDTNQEWVNKDLDVNKYPVFGVMAQMMATKYIEQKAKRAYFDMKEHYIYPERPEEKAPPMPKNGNLVLLNIQKLVKDNDLDVIWKR